MSLFGFFYFASFLERILVCSLVLEDRLCLLARSYSLVTLALLICCPVGC